MHNLMHKRLNFIANILFILLQQSVPFIAKEKERKKVYLYNINYYQHVSNVFFSMPVGIYFLLSISN